MKHILLLLLTLLSSNLVFSQDIIVKQNGEEIKSKVIEITPDAIKYKEYDFQDGPLRNILISDVVMVIYENGRRETYATTKIATPAKTTMAYTKPEVVPVNHQNKYFMLAIGSGNSYGGGMGCLGLRLQFRTGGTVGFGLHTGFGTRKFSEEIFGQEELDFPLLYSIGFKLFVYKALYIDTQMGTTGVEVYSYYDNSWYGYYTTSINPLFGPSVLFGGDFNWGNHVGIGFNPALGLSYNLTAQDPQNDITLAMDLGFVIRF